MAHIWHKIDQGGPCSFGFHKSELDIRGGKAVYRECELMSAGINYSASCLCDDGFNHSYSMFYTMVPINTKFMDIFWYIWSRWLEIKPVVAWAPKLNPITWEILWPQSSKTRKQVLNTEDCAHPIISNSLLIYFPQ